MAEETTLDLAIVRNRLLAGKVDDRDRALLVAVHSKAGGVPGSSHWVYRVIVKWAISNALSDIEAGALDLAARELNLVHNIPLLTDWTASDEEYFLRGTVTTYIEHAPVDRIKGLFSNFAAAAEGVSS